MLKPLLTQVLSASSRAIPWFIAQITRHPRQKMVAGIDFEWSNNSWTHNFFRVCELIFWRKVGIRKEMTTDRFGNVTCFTLEAHVANAETRLRSLFRKLSLAKITIPVLSLGPITVPASPYLFAIAFDATSDAAGATSWSHTCTGSNLLLFADAYALSSSPTAATYNSVSMTKINSTTFLGGSRQGTSLWVLAGPATGAHTIAITSGTGNGGSSFTGCSQTGVPDSSAVNNLDSGASSITLTTTVVATGCWLVCTSADSTGGETGGTGTTIRQTDGNGLAFGDSNGTVGTGSQSLVVNFGGSATKEAGVVASFAPVASAASTVTVLTLPFLGA